MKVKAPKIYSFQVMLDEYSDTPKKRVITAPVNRKSFIFFEESPQMEKKRNVVIKLLKEHQEALREIERAMIDYHKERIVEYPQVSPVPVKSNDPNSESEYFNARVFWPEEDGKQRELRVYLGKKSEFKNFDDPMVIAVAQQKISIQLRRRIKEKSLE